MSKAAPLIIIMLLVGGIVLWGALTDWTFSGLLPREGARCTPGEDEKVENAKEYVYDGDEECTVIQSCETNWKPNSSNTACISTLSGNPCTGAVEKGVYKYNTNGVCVLDSCVTGWQKSGTGCISTLTGDPCDGSDQNAVYKYDDSGVCVFDSCVPGYEESDGVCVSMCDPTTTEYDPIQDGMCLNAENEIVDCTDDDFYKKIIFKSGCGARDVVTQRVDGACITPDDFKTICNSTPGCIGFRQNPAGCQDMLLNAIPACEHSSEQMYAHRPDHVLDESGKLVGDGLDTYYMNNLCAADPDATYETWGTDITQPIGGPCPGEVNEHMDACSNNQECVGFKFNTDENRANACSHFLRRKTT